VSEGPEKEPEKAIDAMTDDARRLTEGIEAEVKDDVEKARGGASPRRPWWKVWARP
jgi:hypothetical protein